MEEARPRYGKGWKADAASAADWVAHAFFGAPSRLPGDVDLSVFNAKVNDQGRTETCVFQAITRALHIRLRKVAADRGLVIEVPEFSVLAGYAPARRRSIGPDAKLEDSGVVPRDAMTTIAENGVPLDADYPFDAAALDVDTPWDVLQKASKFLVFQWYRIVSSGAQRSAAVAQALANGFPVIFGMNLWAAFEAYASGVITAIGRDQIGGHMMCIVGYRIDAAGRRIFKVLNSWGQWGEAGYCWIFEDVLASDRASDFYVIEVQS